MRDSKLCCHRYVETSADGDELLALYLSSLNGFNLATGLGGLHSLPKREMTVQILGMIPTYCNYLVHSPLSELTEL